MSENVNKDIFWENGRLYFRNEYNGEVKLLKVPSVLISTLATLQKKETKSKDDFSIALAASNGVDQADISNIQNSLLYLFLSDLILMKLLTDCSKANSSSGTKLLSFYILVA